MPLPQVVAVAEHSPAERSGVCAHDELRSINGQVPRDVIEYQLLADEPIVELEVVRGGVEIEVTVVKQAGEPLGLEISAAIFDRVRTCDNRCAFCFVRQLPAGMRRSLYVKDDDYRLSFLYGNYTTLTRFTELDLERVVDEGLSPLYVSIHATDPEVRARMLNNPRGAVSLRWLRALLDHGVEVHGQVVVCPGLNDGAVLETTFAGVLDRFPELATVAVVPVGVSRFCTEPAMRPHTRLEAVETVSTVEEWQRRFTAALKRRVVWASDEYYLLAQLRLPEEHDYEGFPQLENGVGMVRAFEKSFGSGLDEDSEEPAGPSSSGCFAGVQGAPAAGYRAVRATRENGSPKAPGTDGGRPITVLTGDYGATVLRPLLDRHGFEAVKVLPVRNEFFGGNIAVAGLITGPDVARTIEGEPSGGRYLLPDVCLSGGRFVDGSAPDELGAAVKVVPTSGAALRRILEEER